MGLFDGNWGNSSLFTGAGLPWGTTDNRSGGGLHDALFYGKGTPWGAPGEKDMKAFATPETQKALEMFPGAGEYVGGVNKGIMNIAGVEDGVKKPDYETAKAFNPNEYQASDYGDYERSNREGINRRLANDKLGMAAGLQKGGALHSGDLGGGLSELQYGADQQRGGLAGAIAQMQMQDKYGQYGNYVNQVNRGNQAKKDKYDSQLSQENANKNSAMDLWKNSSMAYLAL